jgi:hypothetical protein
MEELNLLGRLERVQAPPGFERRVLEELAARRTKKHSLQRIFRFSFAGAMAFFLIGFLVLNVFFLERKSQSVVSGLDKRISSPQASENIFLEKSKGSVSSETIALMESVDYGREVRSASSRPQAIYLLEQVTDAANTQIKY